MKVRYVSNLKLGSTKRTAVDKLAAIIHPVVLALDNIPVNIQQKTFHRNEGFAVKLKSRTISKQWMLAT